MQSIKKYTILSRKEPCDMPKPPKGTGKPQHIKQTVWRILSYMKGFHLHLCVSVLCILISAGASIAGTYFLKPLINNYILPFVGQQNPDLSDFIFMLSVMAVIYLCIPPGRPAVHLHR